MNLAIGRLPSKVFEHLNLGVGLVERAKYHTRTASGRPVYILGEYHVRISDTKFE
ncbi:MAG TPA: hypothetical protein PLO90_06980 [Clostridia bacterium]|nr:hypothetical protein [Clostridia bacterium]